MKPLGFPTARELRSIIWKGLNGSTQLRATLRDCGFDDQLLTDFQFHLGASQQTSVDAFLEYRKEFIEIGKAAMAATLIPLETESRLIRPELESTWYGYLFREVRAARGEFSANQLRIVTFNYDRSMEHYLFLGLRSSFGLKDEAAADLVKQIPVWHAYGNLGDLPYLGQTNVRPYSPTLEPDVIRKAAASIKIVSEEHSFRPIFNPQSDLLPEAKVLCFLGFSYQFENVRRLGLAPLNQAANVFGSAFGMTEHEKRRINTVFARADLRSIGDRIVLGCDAYDALDCLRNLAVF
jgi:hypothetical protein